MTKAVSRFAAQLLRLLRGVMQQAPARQLLPILLKPLPRPRCLSRDAVALVQDTLAKGCVHFLASRGWQRTRFMRDGAIASGRLWERTTPEELGLTFSSHTLELLLQLASGTLGTTTPSVSELTIGDRLVLLLAIDTFRQTEFVEKIRQTWQPIQQDGLCRLAFFEELPDDKQRFGIDWQTWTTGLGAGILESLQGWLADRWVELERKKESVTTAARMRRLGATQTRVLGEYLDALDLTKRRDLARCLLDGARRLLHDQPTTQRWIRNLDVSKVRIADRLAIYHDAFAFLRQLERLRGWQNEAEGVGYFEDSYQASQLWKADWERFGGEQLSERARAIVREIEPL